MSDKRVILIKPGDVLLIGNLGAADSKIARADMAEKLAYMAEALEKVGILAFMFAGDIELDKVPGYAERDCHRLHIDPVPGARAHP